MKRLIARKLKQQELKDKFDYIMKHSFTDSDIDYSYEIKNNQVTFNLYGLLGVLDFSIFINNKLDNKLKSIIDSIKIHYDNHTMNECNLVMKDISYWNISDNEFLDTIDYINTLLDDLEEILINFCEEMEEIGNKILGGDE